MSRVRLEFLQWFGLLAAPLAWTVQLVAGTGVAAASCDGSGGVSVAPVAATLTGVGLAIAVAAEMSAFTVFRTLRAVDHDAPGPEGRLRFFALAALVGNLLFFVVILLSGVGTLAQLPCRQS